MLAGLLLLAVCKKAKGEAVNVGNTQEITILQLANKIKEITRSHSLIEFHSLPKDDPKRRCPDTQKLEKLVSWKPSTTFEEGLKKTIMWFKSKSNLKLDPKT